jgi:hypothetical protein
MRVTRSLRGTPQIPFKSGPFLNSLMLCGLAAAAISCDGAIYRCRNSGESVPAAIQPLGAECIGGS